MEDRNFPLKMVPFQVDAFVHFRGLPNISAKSPRTGKTPQNQSQTIHGTGISTYEVTIKNKPFMSHVDKYTIPVPWILLLMFQKSFTTWDGAKNI